MIELPEIDQWGQVPQHNIRIFIDENDVAYFRVDLKTVIGPSKSGKSVVMGDSMGKRNLDGRLEMFTLNVFRILEPGELPPAGKK